MRTPRDGAALAHTAALTPLETAAAVHDADLARVAAAAGRLDQLLPSVGLALQRQDGCLKLMPAATATTPERIQTPLRQHQAARDLTLAEIGVLARACQGALGSATTGGIGPTVARLRNAGLPLGADGAAPASA